MNVLLSSYDFHESWAYEIMRPIIHQDMKVVVIPFSFDEKEVKTKEDFDNHYGRNGRHTPYIYRPFLFYGIKEEQIVFVDYFRDTINEAKIKVENADIIFLTGGLPDQYLMRLNEIGLSEIIQKNDKIVIGASAGAMVQFDCYHITPDDDYPVYQYQDGLGLVSGFEIEVHYCHSSIQEEGIQRVIKERGLPTYTVANDGGIFVNDGKIIPFGQAFLVNK